MDQKNLKKRRSGSKLRPNMNKIVESILFLIGEAESRKTYVTTYDILKTIFLADVMHLNNYGRPITFDNYYAMKDGPVPSKVYEILKSDSNNLELMKEIENWPLWHKIESPEDGIDVFKYVRPKRSANLRVLSDTDKSALKDSLAHIKAQGFSQIRDMTHQHPAYQEAWAARGNTKSCQIRYELLLQSPDQELISDLVHASHYM